MTDVKQKTLNLLKKLNAMKGGNEQPLPYSMTNNNILTERISELVGCQENKIQNQDKIIEDLKNQVMMQRQMIQNLQSLPLPMTPQPQPPPLPMNSQPSSLPMNSQQQMIVKNHNNIIMGMERFHDILRNYVKNNNNGCCIVGHIDKLKDNKIKLEKSPDVSGVENNIHHLKETMNCVNNSQNNSLM